MKHGGRPRVDRGIDPDPPTDPIPLGPGTSPPVPTAPSSTTSSCCRTRRRTSRGLWTPAALPSASGSGTGGLAGGRTSDPGGLRSSRELLTGSAFARRGAASPGRCRTSRWHSPSTVLKCPWRRRPRRPGLATIAMRASVAVVLLDSFGDRVASHLFAVGAGPIAHPCNRGLEVDRGGSPVP